MKQRTKLVTSIGAAVLIVAVIVYIATTPTPSNYTTVVKCTEFQVLVIANPVVSGSSTTYSTTTTTLFGTYTANVTSSATVGQTTTTTGNAGASATFVSVSNAATIVSISNEPVHSCTYIK